MNSIFYKWCGVTFQISSQKHFVEEYDSAVFRTAPQKPDISVILCEKSGLQTPIGEYLGQAGEKTAWKNGDIICRQTKDRFRKKPHIVVQYKLKEASDLLCTVTEEDWIWATRSQYLWPGLAVNQVLVHFQTLIFHASYIAHKNKAILFVAPSGTGKSTQAELWKKYRGAQIINGDKVGVRIDKTIMAHGVPFSGTSGICQNQSFPVKCIILLSQARENSVRRLLPSESLALLAENVFLDKLVIEEWNSSLNLLIDLVSAIPVYSLACTPDERAVETLEHILNT